jgi:prolyl-tRNA synthetase
MVHGDDMGLRLPPLMAPVQVVVVPIFKKGADIDAITAAAQQLVSDANNAGIRARLDNDSAKSPGFRFSYWEQKVHPPCFRCRFKDGMAWHG